VESSCEFGFNAGKVSSGLLSSAQLHRQKPLDSEIVQV
jgi:hypothetical protein